MAWGRLAVAAVLASTLAGCTAKAPAASPPSPTATGTASPTPSAVVTMASAASPTPSPSPSPLVTEVRYVRQGGIAGYDDRLTVQSDRRFSLTRKRPAGTKTGWLTPDELINLRRTLDDAHFTTLSTVNPGPAGADQVTYAVTYADHQVTAQDGGIPPALQPVISMLDGLVDHYGGP